jgi:hypothetical protein
MKERCPGCGAEAAYVGLNAIECHTPGCANYRAPAPVVRPETRAEAAPEVKRSEADEALAKLTAEELLDSFAFF